MIFIKDVTGSEEQAKPLVISKSTIYVHKNIVKLEPSEEYGTNLYRYDEEQYTPEEYIITMAKKQQEDAQYINELQTENNRLSEEMTSTQLALCDVYEMLLI